ncbi:hypothetical protein MA16_Dca000226 [Dendrobium catenatum]|uniref:Uncharacterized protein n=1 Tax=Dendrobium catenatum TaxID=906689 RepID=A0A2I0WT90_9ASPA|nr:hypothetical protein MA16_Dca000226 [Dendrobium catenatum]
MLLKPIRAVLFYLPDSEPQTSPTVKSSESRIGAISRARSHLLLRLSVLHHVLRLLFWRWVSSLSREGCCSPPSSFFPHTRRWHFFRRCCCCCRSCGKKARKCRKALQ